MKWNVVIMSIHEIDNYIYQSIDDENTSKNPLKMSSSHGYDSVGKLTKGFTRGTNLGGMHKGAFTTKPQVFFLIIRWNSLAWKIASSSFRVACM